MSDEEILADVLNTLVKVRTVLPRFHAGQGRRMWMAVLLLLRAWGVCGPVALRMWTHRCCAMRGEVCGCCLMPSAVCDAALPTLCLRYCPLSLG